MTLPLNTIACADVLDYLRGLPDESAHSCVTSPPYWGLRDYGIPPTEWPEVEYAPMAGLQTVTVPAMECCLGLEPTPDAFVGHIVAVFREVRRALRKDGTLWLNIGDSYANDRKWGGKSGAKNASSDKGNYPRHKIATGLKGKDLIGIPWRLALALQADGWYLRSDVVWSKPNAMPESVEDRPTKAHEYVFLLSKSERYFYDAEAIKDPATGNAHSRGGGVNPKAKTAGGPNSRLNVSRCGAPPQARQNDSFSAAVKGLVAERNARSVWTIATQAFPEAHFATFPEELPKRCIMAGTSERGCCPVCGAPWSRVTKKSYSNPGNRLTNGPRSVDRRHETAGFGMRLEKETATVGWQPSCKCASADHAPCVVLEPFCGAATVPLVATAFGRNWLACEKSPEYVDIGNRRLQGEVGLLLEANA